ncbi:adenylate kinase domain protein [Sphingobacterium spiritivorum ATCC 33300]|uniref:Adenylate kinase domain protein n=1 Tax=Sphingobacterium spiritivorum ATCC 33300 TaxID=525372 RepID=C2G4H1_SPHSI|nr:adenylate kinase domain protein [Sphingobacterium spiritivorum ATCC 33300]
MDHFLESNNSSITGVIALDVNEDELKARIAKRQEISGRADDAADKLTKRIEEYFEKTILVLPYYEAQDKLSKVNGIGDIDSIFGELTQIIDQY